MFMKVQEQRAADLAAKLKGLRSEKRKTLINKEITEMRKKYTLHTLKTYFAEYRKAFPKCKHLFTLSEQEAQSLKSEYENEIQNRTEQGDFIELDKAEVKRLLAAALGLLDSVKPLECALGLLLLTGRRTAEILHSAKLYPKGEMMLFEGLLKQKDSEPAEALTIPILAASKPVLGALAFVRNKIKVDSPAEANNRYAKQISLLCAKHFGANYTPHDLRKIYAALAHSRFGNGQSFRTYASAILGHKGTGLTTETYLKYKIV
jgi:integrase